ncbi:MAG: decarboxylating 6-phosphogluconate dehydrogenase [Deltaproteobacteria bacterium]|nr:decarboxylating 6-phosphogluconate dehydrogenase [Deltaproteobacteria bacterium]
MRIAMVGLGKMGLNMARRLVDGGHEVVGYDMTPDKAKEAGAYGVKAAFSLKELAGALSRPRAVWLMVPAGAAVDGAIEGLKVCIEDGDIIIDGGNSFYKDAVRRAGELERLGIEYIDAGVSGGVWGLENGYCIMAGGNKEAFDSIEPVLKTLAPPQGYLYCGPAGSGHVVKMVHNAIEYGMMEAYAEGFELLNESEYGDGLDLHGVARLWNRGSVVRSWLLELLEGAFKDNGRLEGISGYVEDSGEGRWAVKDAVDRGVPMPVITEALYARFNSRRRDSFAAKVLAALRHSFGGHAVRPGKK